MNTLRTSPRMALRQANRTTIKRTLTASPSRFRIYDDFKNLFDDRPAIEVKTLTEARGFQFVDGLIVPSACIFFDGCLFLWDAPPAPKDMRWEGWLPEHFKLFEAVSPRPEILLMGTGKSVVPMAPQLRKYLNQLGLQVDVLDSWNACSTYNLLAEEGRRVAAAVVPLRSINARTGQRRDSNGL